MKHPSVYESLESPESGSGKLRSFSRNVSRQIAESRPAFSERGCQEKHLPTDRLRGRNTSRGSQPLLRRDDLLIRRGKVSTLHDNWVFSLETEKQTAALMPTTVLFEPHGLSLFQVVREGIQFTWDFGTRPWSIARRDPHPRPYTVPSTPTMSWRNSFSAPANLSERLCRAIQFLWIERDSFLPNNQRDGGDLARQCQSSHLRAHAVLF